MSNWEEKFSRALGRNDVARAVRELETMATDHAGTPPSAIKSRAVRMLRQHIPAGELPDIAVQLAGMPSPTAKELACALLAPAYTKRPASTLRIMIRLADDPNWEVRESAAGLFASVLEAAFGKAYPVFADLTAHESPNVRRAVAVGVKYVGKLRRPEYGPPLLALLERLLPDPDPYVRKNLGPFALGDGLLRAYPELVLEHLEQWADQENEMVRWNVAMCLSAAEARRHLPRILPLLHRLAADERRLVWRAVASAIRNHVKKMPAELSPIIRQWQDDPQRAHVAEVVVSRKG